MVSWGTNQVFTVPGNNTPAPATATTGFSFSAPAATSQNSPPTGFSFGGPAPTPAPSSSSGLFGSATTSFGGPAPAPSTGGLFGTPLAAPPSTSIFGSSSPPAPAPLFGAPAPFSSFSSTAAPAPAFGNTGALFGASPAPATTSWFGAPSNTPTPTAAAAGAAPPQVPAQAAWQAHRDAVARQEEYQIQSALQSLHDAYTGTTLVADDAAATYTATPNHHRSSNSAPFCCVTYNPADEDWRRQVVLQQVHSFAVPPPFPMLAPPKPPQVSSADWQYAVTRNPDPQHCMPVALVGATALQARLTSQQERAAALQQNIDAVATAQDLLHRRVGQTSQQLQHCRHQHNHLVVRMLQLLTKVELARSYHEPLQNAEIDALQRLIALHGKVLQLGQVAQHYETALGPERLRRPDVVRVPDEALLHSVLQQQRAQVLEMTSFVARSAYQLRLVKERAVQMQATNGAVPTVRSILAQATMASDHSNKGDYTPSWMRQGNSQRAPFLSPPPALY